MKVAIVGGHLAPALAVIESLKTPDEIIFIGRKHTFEGDNSYSLEYKVITEKGIPFIPLTTGRIQRKFTRYTFISFLKIPYGFSQAIYVLRKYKPEVVLSFGGYLSVPVGLASFVLGIPLVIHEQTLEIGIANKLLSFFAKQICVGWPQTVKFFPEDKTILTGNPIRKLRNKNSDFRIPNERIPIIYITGGSSGAHALNKAVEGCLENLLKKYIVIHQTGDAVEYNDFEELSTLVKTFPLTHQKRYLVVKFVDPFKIGSILEKATLLVSRAGINTVTEILEFGKPSLLIPLPYGQKNEQLKNAKFLKKTGLAEFILQENVTSIRLLAKIEEMVQNKQRYLSYAKFAKTLLKSDATDRIINVLYEIVSKEK